MPLDEIALTMGKIGAGEWELHIEDGETVRGFFDEEEWEGTGEVVEAIDRD